MESHSSLGMLTLQTNFLLIDSEMDVRVPLFLCLLSNYWGTSARELVTTNLFRSQSGVASVFHLNGQQPSKEVQTADGFVENDQVCTICEQFAAGVLSFLTNNKTQKAILEILHTICSKTHSFEQPCTTLVDYYTTLFFIEISLVRPKQFCKKVNLCQEIVSISQTLSKNSCELCHTVVSEAITKLKDPDTQLEIIEVLLKACDAVQGYVKKCKRLVFEYAPVILVNAEQFLETKDVCTKLHACESATSTAQVLSSSETSLRAV